MSESTLSFQIHPCFGSKIPILWALLSLQVVCTVFFVIDIVAGVLGAPDFPGGNHHETLESVVVLALILGIVFTSLVIRSNQQRQKRMDAQLRAASGAFFQLLEDHFDLWSLTDSERDVALLAIKGLSIAEIASVRQTEEGTIEAQCNAVYRKAGVSGRPQLLSHFIEELLGEGLIELETAAPH